jgi:hypothetical protein
MRACGREASDGHGEVSFWVRQRRALGWLTHAQTLDHLASRHLDVLEAALRLVGDGLDRSQDWPDDVGLGEEACVDAGDERFGVASDPRVSDEEANGGESATGGAWL